MSLRVLAAILFVVFFSFRAWKDWFSSLCAAILLMAAIEHPDMPKSLAGIQGLNLWNILIANVFGGWLLDRTRNNRSWDLPRGIQIHILLYIAVIVVSFLRLIAAPGPYMTDVPATYMVSEYFVNCLKWLLPGLMLYDGCRDRRRMHIAGTCILVLYFLLALQVIRWMPIGHVMDGGDRMAARASKIIESEIGYNRVTLSSVLAGASWAIIAFLTVFRDWRLKLCATGAACSVLLGQALTGGRTGYVSWTLVGLTLSAIKWRKLLLVFPIAGTLVVVLLPGVRDRLLQGVGGMEGNVVVQHDDYEMTSGRTLIWPYVIEEIKKSPMVGYGRQAMITTGLRDYLWETYEEGFPHPHNAYLEALLDNGLIGFAVIVPFLLRIVYIATRLLATSDPTRVAIGGATCAVVLALLVGSLGGQTFYPRETAVGMWAFIGLALRLHVSPNLPPTALENDAHSQRSRRSYYSPAPSA